MIPPDKTARPDQDTFSSQAVQTIEHKGKSFKAFLKKVTNDCSLTFAAALAYTLLFSNFPIVLALLSILGFLLGRFSQAATNELVQGIIRQLPDQLRTIDLIKAVKVDLQRSSGILGLIALVTSLFFGSQLFIILETCFSIIYRVRPRSLIRQQVVAIAMFLLFLLLVPLMVFTASTPTLAFSLVQHTPLGRLSPFVEGVRPIPNDLIAFATTMAGKLNQDIPEGEAQTHIDTRPTEQADKEHAFDVVSKTEEREVP